MNDLPRSLALLRNANPVSADPDTARSPEAVASFEQIVAQGRSARRRSRWPHTPRRSAARRRPQARLAIGGVGLSAVVAAIVVAAVSGSAAGPAFAGWTTRPTPALRIQITTVVHRCGLPGPVLVEARGPFTAAVFASRSGGSACIEGPSMSFVASIGGVRASDNPIGADQIQTAVASGSDSKGHAFVLIGGRVGSAVRSVVIHRSNHINVTASINHGWYLAWWPAHAHATDATVTTANGTRTITLPVPGTSSPPSCGAHPDAACAAVQAGSNGSAGVPGPPLILGPVGKPFGNTVLLTVDNARKVLICFKPPHGSAALQPDAPTGPCTDAARLTRLPASYAVQKNLLEIFPDSVYEAQVPASAGNHGALVFLVIAYGTSSQLGQQRNEFTVSR